ncbi:acylneuraminate cytidylyltransferase family protein [Vibrio coralliilyticus]|nr:acylneuraminate cytidylyltransferase family protein [Vibrio coralliilyticus]
MTKPPLLVIIPARGGSKGLPRKNILELAGKPLLAWTIEECLKCHFPIKVIVSSDDNEILEVAKSYGAETLKRPSVLASDTALSIPVMLHAVEALGSESENYPYIALMQPTSPLRRAKHIIEAYEKLLTEGASSVISVVEQKNNPLKSFIIRDGCLRGISNDEYPFMRRQDLPPTFAANGAIYITAQEELCKSKSLMSSRVVAYEMNEIDSIDIDSSEDFESAEQIIFSLSTQVGSN